MPDYSKGKIYTLRSHQTDKIYIGSTINPLYKRLHQHKKDCKRHSEGKKNFCTSFTLFKFGDVYIELLENYPCSSKEELFRREGELIRINPLCVNKMIAGRTLKEYYQDNWETYKENRERWKSENETYYRQQQKEYRERNPDKIQAYRAKIICPCGKEIQRMSKTRHSQSQQHLKLMETKEKQD